MFNHVCFPFPTVYDCIFHCPFIIKITARIDRPQTQKNWQRLSIKVHQSAHMHWPQFDHHVFSGLLHWLLAVKWRTCNSLFGIELQSSPALDSYTKRRKNKILTSTCGKCSFSKNSNQINIWLLNRGWIRILDCSFYEWIIESTNKIIFPLMNSLTCSDENAWPALTVSHNLN